MQWVTAFFNITGDQFKWGKKLPKPMVSEYIGDRAFLQFNVTSSYL